MAESYSAPDNKLKVQREEVLGWAKQQLADFAKSDLKVQLSAKTIERVERNQGFFTRVTFTRILQTVNAAREKILKLPPIVLNDIFPTLRQKAGSSAKPNKKK